MEKLGRKLIINKIPLYLGGDRESETVFRNPT